MRIVERSDLRLHLRHRPWLAWGAMAMLVGGAVWNVLFEDLDPIDWVIYVPVTFGAVGIAWWGMPAVDVIFDRSSGLVTFEERRVASRYTRRYPLAEVRRVALDYRRHQTPRLNRLMLETGAGKVALERGFGPFDRHGVAAAVNEWLAGDGR